MLKTPVLVRILLMHGIIQAITVQVPSKWKGGKAMQQFATIRTALLLLFSVPPSVSRLSRHCGILDISQSHRPPHPVAGIALIFIVFYSFV
jgi:hypothetical protein